MNSRRIAIVSLVILAALVLIAWLSTRSTNPLPQTYRNNTYGFSLRLPADYAVSEFPNSNPPGENAVAYTIEFKDAAGNLQLTVIDATPSPSVLTVQYLLPTYPWLAAIPTQPFPIAPSVTGLALDDDPSNPNQVNDVWFARGGYLYMLTAFGDGYKDLLPIAHTIALN